jgi:hypothetical protein
VPAVVAHELPEIRHDQDQQHADADGVDQQDHVLPAREIVRILGDACEQEQGDEPQQQSQDCQYRDGGALQSFRNGH